VTVESSLAHKAITLLTEKTGHFFKGFNYIHYTCHSLDHRYSRPWDIPSPINRGDTSPESTSSSSEQYSYSYQYFDNNQRPPRPPLPSVRSLDSGRNRQFDLYQDPKDCIQQMQAPYNEQEIYTEFNQCVNGVRENLYDDPYDMKGKVAQLQQQHDLMRKADSTDELTNEDIYQNSLKLLDEIEYMDSGEMRKIQSKPDASSGQIIVEMKLPIPIPRPSSQQQDDSMKRVSFDKSDISSPMLMSGDRPRMKDRKMIPVKPLPSPRPTSKHSNGAAVPPPPVKPSHSKVFIDNNHNNLNSELKTKLRPVSAVLSLTQSNFDSTKSRYENSTAFKS